MSKTAVVSVSMSPRLKARIAASARRCDQTLSAFLEDLLAATFYNRGGHKAAHMGKSNGVHKSRVSFLDKPMPNHIQRFNDDQQNIH